MASEGAHRHPETRAAGFGPQVRFEELWAISRSLANDLRLGIVPKGFVSGTPTVRQRYQSGNNRISLPRNDMACFNGAAIN
jgi:hypothetical protein